MPYTFQRTYRMRIAERQYALGTTIQFTNLDSCLALVGRRSNGKVFGIHLVIYSDDMSLFDQAAADTAAELLGECTDVAVIGPYDCWQNPENGVSDAFDSLVERFNPNMVLEDRVNGLRVYSSGGRLKYRTGAGTWFWCYW